MKDLTTIIERLIESEVAAGVRLKALSAFLDEENDLQICGEAIFNQAPAEDLSVVLVVLLYDSQGRVIAKDDTYIGTAGLAFDAFEVSIYGVKRPVDRIKIFVKKA